MPNPLRRTTALIEQGIAAGLHIGAQLYISINRTPLADLAIGESRPGVPMTPDTLMPWLSAGKPVSAVAIAQLFEQNKLALDDPVAKFIPAFASHGKDTITIRHLLTHTAGIRFADTGYPSASWDGIIDKICRMKIEPNWEVGKSAGYHIATTWFLLGEIIQRLTHQPVADYIHENIFRPLGMTNSFVAMPPNTYQAYARRIGIMQNTEKPTPTPAGIDTEQRAVAPSPGASLRGPIHELARFYESLLPPRATPQQSATPLPDPPPQLISPPILHTFTARHRTNQYDRTFKHIIDWGLGFIINSAHHGIDTVPYGFGPHASKETFGHGGSQSSTAFADPQHNLVVALVFNGMPGEPKHQQRLRQTLKTIYEDLNLP